MDEIIKVDYTSDQPTVSGRELHAFLEVETPYAKWFNRMIEYGFTDGTDFSTVDKNVHRADGAQMPQIQHDHQLTVPMAKELCMIQRNERGKQARQYFLRIEEQWNSPDAIMERALKIANARVAKLRGENLQLQATNSTLTVEKQVLQPKADYFDQIVDRNLLTNFRETAKQLEVKPKTFVDWLLAQKYIYRDQRGKLMPYEAKNAGLFEVKECMNEKTQWAGTQTLITPKGRETFRLLCQA